MGRLLLALAFACLGSMGAQAAATPARLSSSEKSISDDRIRRILIEQSIADYLENVGNCPCPYNRARNGSRCGRRSAYDRAGGEAPLCYPKDVSDQMVQQYREAHANDS